ncbi:B-cell receptor CD22-like [Labrus bergylta]|uniref:B-cell receptor CD22-like n=1 Tax=Labrus bergylta TaxID=56723 RepID=UPI0033139E01
MVIQGQAGWGVTYSSTEVCALRGSTVVLGCTYSYPSRFNYQSITVQKSFWFTKVKDGEPVDLLTDSQYTGRVTYSSKSKDSTLTITNVGNSDSAVYKFRFITNHQDGSYTGDPGVTLSLTDLHVGTSRYSSSWADLTCVSSCTLPPHSSYIWFKNGEKIPRKTSSTYSDYFNNADSYSCALQEHQDFPSPPVYVPKLPSVSVSPSAEIVENSSVTLTCSSDANPAANYTWYKKNGNPDFQPLSKGPELVFSSVQSSDSGEFYCAAENDLGRRTSEHFISDVKYAPKLPSVSVSPSAEIVEGSSVTLTCSSDANPAAKYTWFKENLLKGQGQSYYFPSIRSEDRGIYYCQAENKHGQIKSLQHLLDVQYAPKLPSVSVSPSAEIVEGSSVTLTCSSDANPAANYTWYKKNEDSPTASGQIFTISNFSADHSGRYYCEAQNTKGRHNSTLHLLVLAVTQQPINDSGRPHPQTSSQTSRTVQLRSRQLHHLLQSGNPGTAELSGQAQSSPVRKMKTTSKQYRLFKQPLQRTKKELRRSIHLGDIQEPRPDQSPLCFNAQQVG